VKKLGILRVTKHGLAGWSMFAKAGWAKVDELEYEAT
jgi:hypothetical protein